MAGKNRAPAKKTGKFSTREIILLIIIAVLIAALLVSLIAGDKLSSIFGSTEDTDSPDKEEKPFLYPSVLSGKGNLKLPPELDGECLEVHFIDVGQGDGIVCMLPDGKILLIDAGSGTRANEETRTEYKNYLKDILNVDAIDYMIITHYDSDHSNMAKEVLDTYDVYEIFYNDYAPDYPEKSRTATYKNFMEAANSETTEKGEAKIHAVGGTGLTTEIKGENYALSVYAAGNVKFTEPNSMSIMAVLSYGGRKVMFTGDAETVTEEWFMETAGGTELDVDILKVGHHGSDTCSSKNFIDFIKPEYAVISCGDGNSYKHPHAPTMNTLFNYGTVTYRTDRHGNIVLYIDEDGDFGFLPEKNVPVENNSKDRNPFTILAETLAAA